MTLYELIKEEDELIKKLAVVDKMLVSSLYTEEEAVNEQIRSEAEAQIIQFRTKKDEIDARLRDVRKSIKIRLFKLLQD